MSHTEGPWRIADTDPMLFGHVMLGYQIWSPDTRVAFTERQNVGSAQDEANASLMAAAPELLEAAKLGLRIADSWIHDQYDGTSFLSGALEELTPIRAAIAKAEGKQ